MPITRIGFGSSTPEERHAVRTMRIKDAAADNDDELSPEYDLSALKGEVLGKYHAHATKGTTLVLLEPDVAEAFPDGARSTKRSERS
jgi:hypothetical protein